MFFQERKKKNYIPSEKTNIRYNVPITEHL